MLKRFKLYGLILGLLTLGLTLGNSGSTHALDVPPAPTSGYVVDNAEILSTEQESQLNQRIDVYKDTTSNEIGIFTVKDGEGVDPAQFATQVGRDWKVGTKENKNGVVIFISLANPKRIQIAVSTGLEGALTDATSGSISRNEIAPKFKGSKYYEGLSAGIDAIDKATKGEYVAKAEKNQGAFGIFGSALTFIVFVLVFLQFLFAILASSKSWWLGGVFGAISSGILAILINSWVALAVLSLIFVPLGLLFDYILSKNYQKHAQKKKTHKDHNFPWYFGGGGGFGSGSSGGGFSGGGFSGGGSFGGGGGGSSW